LLAWFVSLAILVGLLFLVAGCAPPHVVGIDIATLAQAVPPIGQARSQAWLGSSHGW
jgi:hypothetical protein